MPSATNALTDKHTTLLTWYFGPGQCAFERSPIGTMLDRAETYNNLEAFKAQRRGHNKAMGEVDNPSAFADVPQFEAVPTAEIRPAPSQEVDDKALRRFGRASRGLKRLGVICPHGPAIMRGRYGEGSEGWAVKGFLLGGIYAMTESGRALLKRVRREAAKGNKAKLKVQNAALLQNDFQRAAHYEDSERLCEFGQAEGEAQRLLSHAVGVWNSLHEGEIE